MHAVCLKDLTCWAANHAIPHMVGTRNVNAYAALHAVCWCFRLTQRAELLPHRCAESVSEYELAAAGRSSHVTRTLATGTKVAPMVHPPGPSKMYPEENRAIEDYLTELAVELLRNEEASQAASASPETTGVIETPPEWGRPDEGNPNQPRRVPEYQPPQVGSKCTQGCGRGPVLMQYSWQRQFLSRFCNWHSQICWTTVLSARHVCYVDELHWSCCSAVLSETPGSMLQSRQGCWCMLQVNMAYGHLGASKSPAYIL